MHRLPVLHRCVMCRPEALQPVEISLSSILTCDSIGVLLHHEPTCIALAETLQSDIP